MILLFLQPLATKALAFSAVSFPKNAFSQDQLQSNKKESPAPVLETVMLDVEDEDELSELDTHSNEHTFICLSANFSKASCCLAQATPIDKKEAKGAYADEPLYLLWSVFRI